MRSLAFAFAFALCAAVIAVPARACDLPKVEAGLQRTFNDPEGAPDTKAVHDALLSCYRHESDVERKAHEGYLIVKFNSYSIDYFASKGLATGIMMEAKEMAPVYAALPRSSPWFAKAQPLWERAQAQIAVMRANEAAGIHS